MRYANECRHTFPHLRCSAGTVPAVTEGIFGGGPGSPVQCTGSNPILLRHCAAASMVRRASSRVMCPRRSPPNLLRRRPPPCHYARRIRSGSTTYSAPAIRSSALPVVQCCMHPGVWLQLGRVRQAILPASVVFPVWEATLFVACGGQEGAELAWREGVLPTRSGVSLR